MACKFIDILGKLKITEIIDTSVIVVLVEEFGSILNIQPVIHDCFVAKYFHDFVVLLMRLSNSIA